MAATMENQTRKLTGLPVAEWQGRLAAMRTVTQGPPTVMCYIDNTNLQHQLSKSKTNK